MTWRLIVPQPDGGYVLHAHGGWSVRIFRPLYPSPFDIEAPSLPGRERR